MKRLLVCLSVVSLVFLAADPALAKKNGGGKTGKSSFSSPSTVGAVTISNSNTTYTNNNNIQGGPDPGITVTGSNNTIVNNANISGSTGIKVTGGGSITIVNKGTISGISVGGP